MDEPTIRELTGKAIANFDISRLLYAAKLWEQIGKPALAQQCRALAQVWKLVEHEGENAIIVPDRV